MIYDNDTRKIERLEQALTQARQRIVDLEVRYEADCQSCVHDGDNTNKRQCYLCSVNAKSRYMPIGMGLEGRTGDEQQGIG
jgi:hypothetical protein